MAPARLGPRRLGRDADSLVSLVRWRQTVGPPFRFSGRFHFRCSAMANAAGSSYYPGADAHSRSRRRGNSDAPWNSCASRG